MQWPYGTVFYIEKKNKRPVLSRPWLFLSIFLYGLNIVPDSLIKVNVLIGKAHKT